ncbi:entericidin A/B family lipoprotein [Moraxella lincolnii]|uniref:Entericidin n=1 Tax=Lwoffella lincolnii TaxID=90241 RepID=A0A1T0CHF8_9GAMM|nr:entericidin A/B family lipoprotein [Moraxella lincolnii]OOS21571.1 entericidin [Moraxella lincolnii]
MKKKLTLVALAAMMVLTGCNTISGFGKDVSKAGDTVSDTANDVKQKI